jgi:hypothetical protein
MSKVFIEESTLSAIGDAIRAKSGGTELISPADMATAITNLSSGGIESLASTNFLNGKHGWVSTDFSPTIDYTGYNKLHFKVRRATSAAEGSTDISTILESIRFGHHVVDDGTVMCEYEMVGEDGNCLMDITDNQEHGYVLTFSDESVYRASRTATFATIISDASGSETTALQIYDIYLSDPIDNPVYGTEPDIIPNCSVTNEVSSDTTTFTTKYSTMFSFPTGRNIEVDVVPFLSYWGSGSAQGKMSIYGLNKNTDVLEKLSNVRSYSTTNSTDEIEYSFSLNAATLANYRCLCVRLDVRNRSTAESDNTKKSTFSTKSITVKVVS